MAQLLSVKNLLRFDSGAAAASGFTSLLAGRWMAEWFSLPRELLLVLACISLVYASYSGSLAWRGIRDRKWLRLLVVANAVYAVACCILIMRFWSTANGWGVGYLAAEAGFVAVLAGVEWKAFQQKASGSV